MGQGWRIAAAYDVEWGGDRRLPGIGYIRDADLCLKTELSGLRFASSAIWRLTAEHTNFRVGTHEVPRCRCRQAALRGTQQLKQDLRRQQFRTKLLGLIDV